MIRRGPRCRPPHVFLGSAVRALTYGVPMLVLPFSTDQFAGAAAIERHGLGAALDPNAASAPDVIDAVRDLLAGQAPELAAKWCGTCSAAARARAQVVFPLPGPPTTSTRRIGG